MRFNNLQKTIKDRRKHLKITQSDLAELSGVGARTIFQIEKGNANPTINVLEKIMGVLGIEITYIVKGTE